MENKKYTCIICNKLYKTYKSMWHHKNKYHKNISKKSPLNGSDITQISPKNEHDILQISPENGYECFISDNNNKIKKMDNRICDYCNKEYSSYKHLHRHMQICKSKDNIIKQNEELQKKIEDMEDKFEKFKKHMLDMMNQKYKMHPKTFQKMINSNNFSNNFSNNNNITINNIKYVEYGREDLHNVFSKKEKIDLLKQLGSPIENILRYTHLNDKYPQFQNIIITNIRSKQAYAYNEDLNKFILCDKNELLEELIEYRYDDLIVFYEQYNTLLSPKLRDTLEKSFLLKNNKKFNKNKRKEFNVIIYNECNKENIKYRTIDNIIDD